jgi:hypothetical protein
VAAQGDPAQLPRAVQVCREALAVWRQAVAGFPDVPDYRERLADSYHNLGEFLAHSEQLAEADAALPPR